MTPAYPALLVAYGLVWCAGRVCDPSISRHTWPGVVACAAACALASVASFVVSSGSFYLWSGRFEHVSAPTYAASVRMYVMQTMVHAAVYAFAGLTADLLLARRRRAWAADLT